jgi:hypothetical protein
MKANRLLGAALAVGLGLGLAAITSTTVAEAQQKKPKKEQAAPAVAAEPPVTKKTVVLFPKGIAWGMSHKQVAGVIDKMLDAAFKPLYQKVQPGVKMKALDAQLAEEKSAFKRSRIDFGTIPTGFDSTPLKSEYSYNNKEFVMVYSREGTKTYFFFIQDRLWKIIDERTLGEGSPHGKDFKDAVAKLAATFGAPGRVLPAAPDKGRMSTEVDWKDSASRMRAMERSDTAMALALEDLQTLGNLEALRPNKPPEENAIDPAVAAAVRQKQPEAPLPGEKTTKKTQKKK